MQPPPKVFFNGSVGTLSGFGESWYYVFQRAGAMRDHFAVCRAFTKSVKDSTGESIRDIALCLGIDVSNVRYIDRENCFPEFNRVEDLSRFINLMVNLGILDTQDTYERKALGIDLQRN